MACPSIRLLFIERWRHLTDSNEPNFINKNVFKFIKFNWVTGSPPKFYILLKCSFNYPEYNLLSSVIVNFKSYNFNVSLHPAYANVIHAKFHNQPFIMTGLKSLSWV